MKSGDVDGQHDRKEGSALAVNIASAVLVLPVIYQYQALYEMLFSGHRARASLFVVVLCAISSLLSVVLSALAVSVTAVWMRRVAQGDGWWEVLTLVVAYGLLMFFIILTHAGEVELFQCGASGALGVASCVVFLSERRKTSWPISQLPAVQLGLFGIPVMLEVFRKVLSVAAGLCR